MIPLHDDIPSRRTPIVTTILIFANLLAFVYELSLGPKLGSFLHHWAVIPGDLLREWPVLLEGNLRTEQWISLISAMFLHGGWLHLGGNLLFLWIFGDNVEDAMGHLGFLLFFLLAGLGAWGLQIALEPSSLIPALGASGAIAGVLGAYLVLFPEAEVLTLVPLGFLLTTMRISARWFLFIWFAFQALHGVTSLAGSAGQGGVAWWAHIGGFAVGLLVGWTLKPRPPRRNRFADRWYSNR